MQIEKVRIKGFRNFVDEEIVFAQQTLLYNSNDIGKTNLLYALRILLDRSLSDRDLDLEISDYNIYSVEKRYRSRYILRMLLKIVFVVRLKDILKIILLC